MALCRARAQRPSAPQILAITNWSDTLTAGTVASGTFTGSVKVTVGGITGPSSNFAVANLFVDSFSPKAGPVNTQVTVNGNGFGTSQGLSTISFNNVAATNIISWSDTQIVATVPASATTGVVKVTVGPTAAVAVRRSQSGL